MAVKNTKVNETRNLVVHKIAYRPTREEADRAYKEAIETLPLLTNHLNLDDDINHYNSNRPFS
jgi:hypothetical protein